MAPGCSTAYDESRWPFLLVTKGPEEQTEPEFTEHLATLSSYFRRGQRFGLVMDVRRSPILSAERRRTASERMEADMRQFGPLLVGVALVVSSPVSRGMFKALLWLRPRQQPPMLAFPTVEPAMQWLRDQLRKESRVTSVST
ncbi:MAG TPA: hypothetical protein VER33_20470 [Polyangiaceae bacterium]|nr:hypothetical protein [Polyangiaceae bacterium]